MYGIHPVSRGLNKNDFFFVLDLVSPFNTFPVISGRSLLVTGYDNHLIGMSHWNISLHSQSYDIPPSHNILAKGQPGFFALNYPLYARIWQGSFTVTNLKSSVWLSRELNKEPKLYQKATSAGLITFINQITIWRNELKAFVSHIFLITSTVRGGLFQFNFWLPGSGIVLQNYK